MTAEPFDKRWIKKRVADLHEGGMTLKKAREFAQAEAKGRRRIARMAGVLAASKGELTFDSGRPILLIDSTLIPFERREAARSYFFGPKGPMQ